MIQLYPKPPMRLNPAFGCPTQLRPGAIPTDPPPGSFWARYLAKVCVPVDQDPNDPAVCWGWHGTRGSNKYPRIFWHGRSIEVHRALAAERFNDGRELSPGVHVRHLCGRRCATPHHLALGTASDNLRDRYDHARVRKIRTLYAQGFAPRVIAQRCGVSISTVYRVVRRETWRLVA